MKTVQVTIKNSEGLHARPAALFVNLASTFNSEIKLFKNGDVTKPHDAKSIISVMIMAARMEDVLTLQASGEDEEDAVDRIKELVESGFKS